MTILKCKMCGGNIVLTGETHGVCDSCGTEVTLPKIDDEARAELYNRGNYARQMGDFDRAYSAFEHIIAADPTDAEAHWCLTLCRYGIEYVQDPRTGERKPTCSRVNYEPLLEDMDYLAALKYSDEYTQQLYRRDARRINDILVKYTEIARKEAPYDVFICYKAVDDAGQRTKDSVIAQDLYDALTQKGLKVFFSRVTLQDKQGEAYEPYIFAALHSANIMLLVATRKEHLEARWVKNEWSRYVSLMREDRNRHIFPVYADMDPDDFPIEIATYQGVDITQVGAQQDLIRGVMKMVAHSGGHQESPDPGRAVAGSGARMLTEAEKRIGKVTAISFVNSRGTRTRNASFSPAEAAAYSSAINMDLYSGIQFDTTLVKAYTEEKTVTLGYAIYDELNNLINKKELSIKVKNGVNKLGILWQIVQDGVPLVVPGSYRAELWVDDSAAYTYRFQIASQKVKGDAKIQLSEKEAAQREQEEQELKIRQQAVTSMQKRIGDKQKYLSMKVSEKVPGEYTSFLQSIEDNRALEKKCPKTVRTARMALVCMVISWIAAGILYFTGNIEAAIATVMVVAGLYIFPLTGALGLKLHIIWTPLLWLFTWPFAMIFLALFTRIDYALNEIDYYSGDMLLHLGFYYLRLLGGYAVYILICFLLWTWRARMFRKKEEGWQRTFDYHKEHIYPVEQEVQRELDKEYLDFTGAQNPIKLGSLIENYMSKKK